MGKQNQYEDAEYYFHVNVKIGMLNTLETESNGEGGNLKI